MQVGRRYRFALRRVSTLALVLSIAQTAAAQTQTQTQTQTEAAPASAPPLAAAPASPANADASGIADIIVTAERRSSSVQKTPLAITALGGEALTKNQGVNFEALADKIPNVTFGRNSGSAKVFIRGIGLDAITPGSDSRVALYTDGVYNARSQSAFLALYDIDRIEVLAGPQGTLYGRNATAGAINIISRDPIDDFSGYASLTGGNYGLIRAEGAVGGPIADGISGRVAFQTSDRNGYGKQIQTGQDVDDERYRAVRGKLRIRPSSNFDVVLEGDYYNSKDHSGGYHYLNNSPGYTPVGVQEGFSIPENPRDLAGPGPLQHIRNYGFSGTATLDLGGPKLVSVTGYRRFQQDILTSSDGSTSNYLPTFIRERSKQFSEELRLSGTIGPIDYLLGGYYFNERNGTGLGAAFAGVLIGIPTTDLLFGTRYGGRQTTDAYAAFSQITGHITDKLGVDLGLRYSYERRHVAEFNDTDFSRPYDPSVPFFDLAPDTIRLNQKVSYKSTDPKVTVHYQINPTVLAYATYSRGFKSGGFNLGFLQNAFSPERLVDYEAGIKADLFDRRLRANIAGFYYDYSNLQVNVTEGLVLVTRNAAKARLYGLEGQFTALPTDDLRLQLNLSWLHSEYLDYISPDPSFPGQGDPGVTTPSGAPAFNLRGNQLAYAPKYKVDAEIGYTVHNRIGDFTPRAEVVFTTRTWFSQFNHPWVSQPSHAELNLFLDYTRPNTGWSATAFMRNVTNKFVENSATVSSDFQGFGVVGQIAPPRTFGATITKKF